MEFCHTNQRTDHRINRSGKGRPSPPPVSVRHYIQCCENNHLFERQRYEAIPNRYENNTRRHTQPEEAWVKKWKHTRPDPSDCISVNPCDTKWVRCPEEVEYQAEIADLLRIIGNRTEEYKCYGDRPTTFPRPIIDWCMLENREVWIEDAGYEARMRWMKFNKSEKNKIDKIGLLVGWQDVILHSIPIDERENLYYKTAELLMEIEQRCLHEVMEKETIELTIAVWMHCCRYGVIYTKSSDPRIRDSNRYGILTSISSRLRHYVTDSETVRLYYG